MKLHKAHKEKIFSYIHFVSMVHSLRSLWLFGFRTPLLMFAYLQFMTRAYISKVYYDRLITNLISPPGLKNIV
jgi:hypothetical protein